GAGRGHAATGARGLEHGAAAVVDAAEAGEDALGDGAASAGVGDLEGHEVGAQLRVVALEGDGGEEALAAGAELEVVGGLRAVAGGERAAAGEEQRLDVVGEEGATRIAGAEVDAADLLGP